MTEKIYYTIVPLHHIEIAHLVNLAKSFTTAFFFHDPHSFTFHFAYGELSACHFSDDQDPFSHLNHWLQNLDVQPTQKQRHPSLRSKQPEIVGGFGFSTNSTQSDTLWGPLKNGQFFLPKFLLVQSPFITYLICCSKTPANIQSQLADFYTRLNAETASVATAVMPNPVQTQVEVAAKDWQANVTKAVAAIKDKQLEKVVLARSMMVSFATKLNPLSTWKALIETQPQAYHILFKTNSISFISATPELFAEFGPNHFQTAAVAGTSRRGLTAADDDALGKALLADPKNQHEHEIVATTIYQALKAQGLTITMPDQPQLLKNPQVQHLFTPLIGKGTYNLFGLLSRLHPTPALGGFPKSAALSLIQQFEPQARGLFGAPIGYFDLDLRGKLAVGIRSALLSGNHAHLFAGAGIVADSSPEKELVETRLKFQPMLQALTLNSRE